MFPPPDRQTDHSGNTRINIPPPPPPPPPAYAAKIAEAICTICVEAFPKSDLHGCVCVCVHGIIRISITRSSDQLSLPPDVTAGLGDACPPVRSSLWDVFMHVCVYVCMYVCVYVFMYVSHTTTTTLTLPLPTTPLLHSTPPPPPPPPTTNHHPPPQTTWCKCIHIYVRDPQKRKSRYMEYNGTRGATENI